MDAMMALTGLLALGTFWLAWSTRSMAAATKQLAELEAEPYLALKEVVVTPGAPSTPGASPPFVNIELKLSNPGKVLVHFRMASLAATVHGAAVPPSSTFTNRGGVIHPGTETTFFYPSVHLPPTTPSP